MRIVVLVKQVPDTEEPRHLDLASGDIERSGDDVIDEITERAIAWALPVAKANKAQLIALTMGPEHAGAILRHCLALGADEAVHVIDEASPEPDAVRASAVLAAALRQIGADLIVTGDASTDTKTGALAAMLAERLGLPHASYLSQAEVAGGTLTGQRESAEAGQQISVQLPAVVSVTEAIAEPEVPGFRGIMGAKRKPRRTLSVAELGLGAPTAASWARTAVTQKPARGNGELHIDEGDGAARIADFLAANQIIGK